MGLGTILFILICYLIFAIPTFIGIGVTYFLTHKKVTFNKVDYLFAILPWLVWLGFILIFGQGKTMSNAVRESFYLAGFVVLFFLIRCLLEYYMPQTKKLGQYFGIVGSSLFGVLLWAYMPGIPV